MGSEIYLPFVCLIKPFHLYLFTFSERHQQQGGPMKLSQLNPQQQQAILLQHQKQQQQNQAAAAAEQQLQQQQRNLQQQQQQLQQQQQQQQNSRAAPVVPSGAGGAGLTVSGMGEQKIRLELLRLQQEKERLEREKQAIDDKVNIYNVQMFKSCSQCIHAEIWSKYTHVQKLLMFKSSHNQAHCTVRNTL